MEKKLCCSYFTMERMDDSRERILQEYRPAEHMDLFEPLLWLIATTRGVKPLSYQVCPQDVHKWDYNPGISFF